MEGKRRELNIDYGLNVFFDGGKYQLAMFQCTDCYPVGGLICEYMRLLPTDIKGVIMSCAGLSNEGTRDYYMKTFLEFHEKINETFPPVISSMIVLEFLNSSTDWFKAVKESREEEYLSLFNDSADSVRDYIFEDTGYEGVGGDTVLQILLTAYLSFADKYILTKHMFSMMMKENDADNDTESRGFEAFISMYGEHMDMQHIDFRMVLTDNGFESLYTIKSSFSLLIFDLGHCINQKTTIAKCKNCGHYFVPEGRSDTVYCSYPLRDDASKTCKDVGAKIARAKKEKSDIATKEYRKTYMRLKMKTNRHPEDAEAAEQFKNLTEEIGERRRQLEENQIATDEFLAWLRKF